MESLGIIELLTQQMFSMESTTQAVHSLQWVMQEPSSHLRMEPLGIIELLEQHNLFGLTYGNSTFVTVGKSGTILTSSDGTTWDNSSSGTTDLHEVTYGNNTFVTVGPSGTILTSSNNGTTWNNRTSGTTEQLVGITYKE